MYYTDPTKTASQNRFFSAETEIRSHAGVWLLHEKVLVCLRKLAPDNLPFKNKVLPLCCYGTNATLTVLQGRRACVFPCA